MHGMHGFFHEITAGLVVMSLTVAATGTVAHTGRTPSASHHLGMAPSLPPPENTEASEPEWASLPPAAKIADLCEDVDVAPLEGEALIDYLRTTSESCLERTLFLVNNRSIKNDLPTLFSDRNMQSVFAEIEKSRPRLRWYQQHRDRAPLVFPPGRLRLPEVFPGNNGGWTVRRSDRPRLPGRLGRLCLQRTLPCPQRRCRLDPGQLLRGRLPCRVARESPGPDQTGFVRIYPGTGGQRSPEGAPSRRSCAGYMAHF